MGHDKKQFWTRPIGPALAVALSILVAGAREAHAYDVLLNTTLIGQGYQLRAADGRVLNRRRVDFYLRLYVYDILPEPKDPDERMKPHPQMHFVSAMRLDADFGSFAGADGEDLAVIDEEMPSRPTFQLLFGYLGVTDLARGWLNLKAGRQFRWDAMDAYSFDGVTVEVTTPWHATLEVFAGSRVNGTLPIDSPILLMDGTSPTQSPVRWAPAFGVALATRRLEWLYARVAYRHTLSVLEDTEEEALSFVRPDESAPSCPQRLSTSEERVTAWVSVWKKRLLPYAGVAYSVMHSRFARALAGARVKFGPLGVFRSTNGGGHSLGLEYARHEPTFDGDSIFNIFNTEPFTEARAFYELDWDNRWSAYLRGTLRFFRGGLEEGGTQEEREELSWKNPGGGLGVRYSGRSLTARGDWYWQEGYGGRTLGFDFYLRHQLQRVPISWETRATVAHWSDDLSPELRGITAGVAVGATWRFHERVAAHLMVEDNFGEHYDSDLRIYTMLQVTWCTSGRCTAGVEF